MPQSSTRLRNTPTERSDARSVRAASAVPIWPAIMPEKRDGHDPRNSRKRSGADQQQRERMCQLVRELTWPAPSAATPQLIRPELNEPALRLT